MTKQNDENFFNLHFNEIEVILSNKSEGVKDKAQKIKKSLYKMALHKKIQKILEKITAALIVAPCEIHKIYT